MKKRLKKILNEINLGKIKDLSKTKFSINDYLSKDEEGITFLEHLLKNKINVKYYDTKKFGKYPEIIYLYCKYGGDVFSFDYKEEILFSNFNGKRVIDLLAETKNLWSKVIEAVKNNIEIIDIVVNNDIYKLPCINQELINKLLISDSKGNYPLQKYMGNEKVMNSLILRINNPKLLIEFCKNNNKYELLKYSNEKVLMYELSKDYTLLEDLLNKNIRPNKLNNVPANINFVKLLLKHNLYEDLVNEKESVLLLKIDNKKTLLEELIEKNLITKIIMDVEEKETIQILYKMNKLDLLVNVDFDLLKEKVKNILKNEQSDNRTLLEYMIDKGYNPLLETNYLNPAMINFLCEKKCYKILGEIIDESALEIEVEDGVLLIDKLLENNCNINFKESGFESVEIAKKLYEKNRADLLVHGDIFTLFELASENETYFDYILESIKNKKIKYNLNNFGIFIYKKSVIAKFYLMIAKHDMMEYVDALDEKDLLNGDDNNTLLDELLKLDSKLTVNKVLSDNVKSKMKIAIILKSRGIEQKNIDLPLENSNFTDEYLLKSKNKLGIGPLQVEGEYLLRKLKQLFDSDGKSDKELVSTLISGYRQALFNNYDLYIQELRNLVDIKEKNLNKLLYLKDEDKAFFSLAGRVYSSKSIVGTLLHETGHALHSYLTNFEIPKEYEDKLKEVRNNPETLKKVEQYANEYNMIKNGIIEFVKKKYETYFEEYYTDEKKKEIEKFLDKSLIDKKEEFKSLEINEETLDIILNNYFTVETYIETQKRIFILEYSNAILRNEIGPFMSIGDILDSIYEGELSSKVLKNENGELIKGTPGHGISYYSDKENSFLENIANFASISKSRDSKIALNRLKDIIGEDLYTVISKFYYENIVSSKSDEKDEIKLL